MGLSKRVSKPADLRILGQKKRKPMHTINANRVVGLEGVGDAGGSQKGDDDGNHNKQRSEHCDATSTSGTPGVHNLGTETGKEDQSEVDRENARKEKGSDGKSLHKFEDAEDGMVPRVGSSDGGLLPVNVCGGSPLLKAEGSKQHRCGCKEECLRLSMLQSPEPE